MIQHPKVDNWLNVAQRLIYPHRCVLCQGPGDNQDLCAACAAELPWNRHACPACAHPLNGEQEQALCGQCQQRRPLYTRAYASFRYAYPLDQLLQAFKFRQQLHLAPLLGRLMAADIQAQAIELPELILPVPLHRRRLWSRGYNQALELARPLARQLGIPIDTRSLTRTRATAVQSELSARERRKNLRAAFGLGHSLRADHVAIFDDVVSTGSTVTELTRVLRRSGVRRVDVWSCARTEKTL